MQISTTQASAANPYDDVKWAGYLRLDYLFDFGLFFVVV
jgi:hypothetical protein